MAKQAKRIGRAGKVASGKASRAARIPRGDVVRVGTEWMAIFNSPTAAIPGHIIKEQAEPHIPIALVPHGQGNPKCARAKSLAIRIAALPVLEQACEDALVEFSEVVPDTDKITCMLSDALFAAREARLLAKRAKH